MRSFSNELNRFALAVSIMDKETWSGFQKLLHEHLLKTLEAHYFRVLIDGARVGAGPGLTTIWTSDKVDEHVPIFESKDKYYGQASLAYDRGVPLWITTETREPLAEGENYVESWTKIKAELPPYRVTHNLPTKTAICVPLKFGERVFGVFIIEHPDYLEARPAAFHEIQSTVNAISRVIWIEQTTSQQFQGLQGAFDELSESLDEINHPPLRRPQVFVASPTEGDDKVIACVLKVLDEYSNVKVKYWKRLPDPGSITETLVKEISNSIAGIFYFSQPIGGTAGTSEKSYTDNGNVLFEAGMLHSLVNNRRLQNEAWIPIRENEKFAGRSLFDIADQKMIIVPRDQDHEVIEEELRENLRNMLDKVLPD